MTLIKCNECGKKVSDKAKSCPNCGNPINIDKSVKIKLPSQIGNMQRPIGYYVILDKNNKVIAKKRTGEIVEFNIDKPTILKIKVGGLAGFGLNSLLFKIKPGGRYEVTHSPYSFNPFSVGEIDFI